MLGAAFNIAFHIIVCIISKLQRWTPVCSAGCGVGVCGSHRRTGWECWPCAHVLHMYCTCAAHVLHIYGSQQRDETQLQKAAQPFTAKQSSPCWPCKLHLYICLPRTTCCRCTRTGEHGPGGRLATRCSSDKSIQKVLPYGLNDTGEGGKPAKQ